MGSVGFFRSLRVRILLPVVGVTAGIVSILSWQLLAAQRDVAHGVRARVESIAEVFGQIFAAPILEGQSADFDRLQNVMDSIVEDDRSESTRHGRAPFLAFLVLREGDTVVGAANGALLPADVASDLASADRLHAQADDLRATLAKESDPARVAADRREVLRLVEEREKERDAVLGRLAEHPSNPGLEVYDAKLYDCRPFNCPTADADLARFAVADVLVGINFRPFAQQARTMQGVLVSVSVLALALGIAGAWAAARQVTRPVSALVGAMGDIERGRLDRRVDIRRGDELGLLANSFNVMASGLEEREKLRAEQRALKREVALAGERNVQLTHDKDELERNKARVESLLSALASREVAQQFLRSNDELGFEGKEAEATILFADIRGFTPMCERLSTEEIFDLLNTYFARMRGVIDKYEGTILKFMGDALMASWNVPEPLDLHAARAVYAGIDMQREIRAINKEREAAGKEPLQVGIGINTGKVMLGAIGTAERFDFTVIGDAVNTAQRIESITPAQHLHVSQSTWEQVKDYIEVVPRDPVTLKGKERPVSIYAVLHRSRTPAHFHSRDERDETVRVRPREKK